MSNKKKKSIKMINTNYTSTYGPTQLALLRLEHVHISYNISNYITENIKPID